LSKVACYLASVSAFSANSILRLKETLIIYTAEIRDGKPEIIAPAKAPQGPAVMSPEMAPEAALAVAAPTISQPAPTSVLADLLAP
jgi:hypothetical protein